MNDIRTQDLGEAFNSIISMMLAMLRARGLRGLLDLPNMIISAIYLRRLGREFAALVASFKAGTPPPVAPASAPWPQLQAAPAQPALAVAATRAQPRLAPRAPRARARSAAPQPVARQTCARQSTRHPSFARPGRAPKPGAGAALPYRVRETGRRP